MTYFVAGMIVISCISRIVIPSILDLAVHRFELSDWYLARTGWSNHVGLHETWYHQEAVFYRQDLYNTQVIYGNIQYIRSPNQLDLYFFVCSLRDPQSLLRMKHMIDKYLPAPISETLAFSFLAIKTGSLGLIFIAIFKYRSWSTINSS